MSDLLFQGLPLTPAIARRLILEVFGGKTSHRQDIVDRIVQLHRARGGDADASSNPTATIKKALQHLKEAGLASNPQQGYWNVTGESNEEIDIESSTDSELEDSSAKEDEVAESASNASAERVFGTGSDSVYLYYYPTYREVAESKGNTVWPCKIGMSERDPLLRILSQGATAMPEAPKIGLIIKTDQAFTMEKALHYILALKGKRVESPGTEWFLTNPAEVEKIVHWIEGNE